MYGLQRRKIYFGKSSINTEAIIANAVKIKDCNPKG